MIIEVEIRAKVIENGNARTVTYNQHEQKEVGDNPALVQKELRVLAGHVQELVMSGIAVQYPTSLVDEVEKGQCQ